MDTSLCTHSLEDCTKISHATKVDIDTATDQLLRAGIAVPFRRPPFSCMCSRCVEEIRAHLDSHELRVGAHVAAKAPITAKTKPDADFYCYDHTIAVSAPGLFNLAVAVLPIVESLFDQEPVLYSMNIYGVRGGKTRPGVNEFHRDYGDTKQCALLMYLSEVDHYRHGPFQYVQHSHGDPIITKGDRLDLGDIENVVVYDRRYHSGISTIYGQAGTFFMFDPRGEHRAVPALEGDRLAFWARYGVSDRPADYIKDKLSPVDPRILRPSHHSDAPKEYDVYVKRRTRLLIDW